MRFKKQKNFSRSITILLISINFLLFVLLILVCYIAVESKIVFQKKLNSLDQKVEKHLGNLEQLGNIRNSLEDLSKASQELGNTKDVEEKIFELTNSINNLGSLESINKKLENLGDNLVLELRSNLKPLAEFNNNLNKIKENLDNLKDIKHKLNGLSSLENISNKIANLEEIKNNLGNLNLGKLEEKLTCLGEEGEGLVNEFNKINNSFFCPKCNEPKPINSAKLGSIQIGNLVVEEEVWKKWLKEDERFKLKYQKWSFVGWGSKKNLDKKNSAEIEDIKKNCQEGKENSFCIVKKDKDYKCPECERSIKELKGINKYEYKISEIIKLL